MVNVFTKSLKFVASPDMVTFLGERAPQIHESYSQHALIGRYLLEFTVFQRFPIKIVIFYTGFNVRIMH